MQIEIRNQRENKLLDRSEVHFVALHEGDKTPTREQLKKALTAALGSKADVTVIDNIKSDYGRGASSGFAKVYSSVEKARYHERHYLQKRNGIFVEPAKKEE